MLFFLHDFNQTDLYDLVLREFGNAKSIPVLGRHKFVLEAKGVFKQLTSAVIGCRTFLQVAIALLG